MEILKGNNPFLLHNETAAAIGFFDGVHKGHQFLFNQLKKYAVINKLSTMMITFQQFPQAVLKSGFQPQLLNTFDEKIYRLSTTGIDYCLLLDFTKSLSQLTAKEFIQKKLREELNVRLLLIGYDHRFGKNRSEGFDDYLLYGKECGMDIILAPELPDISVSSTLIRKSLAEKDVNYAYRMLSYFYCLEGKVIEGDRIGMQIGFPTANLEVFDKSKIIPGEGVYAAIVNLEREKRQGMVYIGKRPTVSVLGEKRIEIHLFNFSGDLYGKTLRLEFVDFIREDKHFVNLEELKKQLYLDKEAAISILNQV